MLNVDCCSKPILNPIFPQDRKQRTRARTLDILLGENSIKVSSANNLPKEQPKISSPDVRRLVQLVTKTRLCAPKNEADKKALERFKKSW